MKKYIKDLIKQGIIVFTFPENGNCPLCSSQLIENEFRNYDCLDCWKESLFNHKQYLLKLLKKCDMV